MAIDNTAGGLKGQISEEIRQYTTEFVNIGEAYDYSQFKLVRRITLFENHTYPTGKFDSQGNYKFWYDGISSRVSNEVKNIGFNTKDVIVYSDRATDDLACIISNLRLKKWLRDNNMDTEFDEATEEGSGWGNVVWKKMGKKFERVDLKNFYVISQTATVLEESPVIERHPMSASDLRAMSGKWENVAEVIKQCKSDTYKPQIQSMAKDTTVPFYEIFERNGDVCLADLKRTLSEEPEDGDEDKYVFAKVICAAKSSQATGAEMEYVMFAQEMKGKDNGDLYAEFHRGPYRGRWFREGMFELLFDCQVRLNQIGNQIAQGLELASKVLLQSKDKLVVQNITTDLKNGDVIRTEGLSQISVVMQGFNQLVADWNTTQQLMNDIANSSPILTGEGIPQRMAFQIVALLNQNANKLFDYIRQKMSIPMTRIFMEWILPQFLAELSAEDVVKLTGDEKMLDRIRQMVVQDWYVQNLVAIGPHGQDAADFLMQQQMNALKKRPHLLMQGLKKALADFEPSISVVIAGENSTLPQDMQTLSTFIQMETDPVRRSAMIELAMAKKGIDVASLPKSSPQAMLPATGGKNNAPPVSGEPPADGDARPPNPPAPHGQKRGPMREPITA